MAGGVEVEDARFFGAQDGALVQARQPTVAPVVIAIDRFTAGILEHHVGGQLVVFTAEAVGEPRAEAGPADHARDARVDVTDGNLVAVVAGVHASDHAEIVSNLCGVGQEFAEIHPALAVFLELPRAAEKFAAGLVGKAVMDIAAIVHAVTALQFGLGIGEIHVAWAAVHEQGNHRLGPGHVMRLFGLKVKTALPARDVLGRAEQFLALQQPRQREAADTHRVADEKLAAVEKVVHAKSSFTTRAFCPSVRVCSCAARL